MAIRTASISIAILLLVSLACVGCGGPASGSSKPIVGRQSEPMVTGYPTAANTAGDVVAARKTALRTLNAYPAPSALRHVTQGGAEEIPIDWWDYYKVPPHKLVTFEARPRKGSGGMPYRYTVVQPRPGDAWVLFRVSSGY